MEELLTPKQLAAEVCVTLQTVYNWLKKGTGPRFVIVGGGERRPRYKFKRSDVEAWLVARRAKYGNP